MCGMKKSEFLQWKLVHSYLEGRNARWTSEMCWKCRLFSNTFPISDVYVVFCFVLFFVVVIIVVVVFVVVFVFFVFCFVRVFYDLTKLVPRAWLTLILRWTPVLTQSPQAIWPAVGRLERLWRNRKKENFWLVVLLTVLPFTCIFTTGLCFAKIPATNCLPKSVRTLGTRLHIFGRTYHPVQFCKKKNVIKIFRPFHIEIHAANTKPKDSLSHMNWLIKQKAG